MDTYIWALACGCVGVHYEHVQDMSLEEIGLHVQTIVHCIRFSSQDNFGRGLYDHLMSSRIYMLTMNKTFFEL